MLYRIAVPTVIDRIYRVEASSPEEALDLYHNGAGVHIALENEGVVFEEDDSSDAHEIADEATVEEIG